MINKVAIGFHTEFCLPARACSTHPTESFNPGVPGQGLGRLGGENASWEVPQELTR